MDKMNTEREKIKVGVKVYGLFAHFHPIMHGRTANTRYEGVVVKVEETCFRARYKGIRIDFPHRYEEIGRNVFLDEMSSEDRLAEIDSPIIKIGE